MLNASIYLFNVLESVGLVPLCRMFTLIPSSITVSTQTLPLESILISYFIFKSYLYFTVEEIQAFMPLALRMISSLSLKQVSSGLCRRRHCGRGRRSRCRVLRPATTSILL